MGISFRVTDSSNPENTALLREMGVDEVIETRDSPDWGDKVRPLRCTRRGTTLIVESSWFEFRTEALRQIVLDWREEHHIAWA